MIEGTIEAVHTDRRVVGWLRDTGDPAPCPVEIRNQGRPIAAAIAMEFRPDLLAGGHGHGHYGFRARLRLPLEPGICELELFLPRQGQGVRIGLLVPAFADPPAPRVEQLLKPVATWTRAAVMARPACLELPRNLAALGTAKFLDALFQFALERFPEPDETAVLARALDEGRLAPDGLLAELLGSRERDELGEALVSPFDPIFPFLVF